MTKSDIKAIHKGLMDAKARASKKWDEGFSPAYCYGMLEEATDLAIKELSIYGELGESESKAKKGAAHA